MAQGRIENYMKMYSIEFEHRSICCKLVTMAVVYFTVLKRGHVEVSTWMWYRTLLLYTIDLLSVCHASKTLVLRSVAIGI